MADRIARVLMNQLKAGEIPRIGIEEIEAAVDAMKPISALHREFTIALAVRRVIALVG